ncbi:MAG: GntR family transcriptional regulator [Thermomicrobiales bacterium]|nr:GntR family transcriptional regulator [Thermomicrobiales bacterium]
MAEALLKTARVDRSDLEERVYSELRNRIMARDIPPGTTLTLRQVAEALEVSATPVRDALRRLNNDGLVRDGGKQGFSVIGLGAQDIVDLFGARLAIEGYAARIAAAQLDRDRLRAEMTLLVTSFPATFEGDHYIDYERFQALDSAFHITIIEATGNARLVGMYQALNVHIHLARIYQREHEQRAIANHQEHLAIVTGLERGDPDATERAVEAHIVNVRDHILSKLGPDSLI